MTTMPSVSSWFSLYFYNFGDDFGKMSDVGILGGVWFAWTSGAGDIGQSYPSLNLTLCWWTGACSLCPAICLGGFGIRDPQQCSDEFDVSAKVTLSLVGLVLEQQMQLDFSVLDVKHWIKQEVVALKYQKQCTLATKLRSSLSSDLQHTLTLASERVASS